MKNTNKDDRIKKDPEPQQFDASEKNQEATNPESEDKTFELFQQKFNDFEMKPQEKVWDEIQPRLPFNLKVRKVLSWVTRVAAILLIGMLATIVSKQLNINHEMAQTIPTLVEPIAKSDETPPVVEADEPVNFVFDISDNKSKVDSKSFDEDEDLESLLAFILDDSDELADNIDQEVVDASISPADVLPMEGLVLVVPEDDELAESEPQNDLTITIPLVVVEESEIESLLDIYDANASHGASTTAPEQ